MATVLTKIEPNPKRANSGAWHRYNLYELGRTEEDLLAMGLQKGDLAWDVRQGFVQFGEGECSTLPLPPPPDAAQKTSPAAQSVRTPGAPRAVRHPVESAAGGTEPPSVSTDSRAVPGPPLVSLSVPPPSDATRLASWYKIPALVEATAGVGPSGQAGNTGRDWTVTVVLADGTRRSRRVVGDQLGLALVRQILLHGFDPDEWVAE